MLAKCCCCVPLRTGSIILAVLGILGGIFQFIGGQWTGIITGILYLSFGGCLLFGALKYHEKAVLAALAIEGACIVLSIIFGIIVIAAIEVVVPALADDCNGSGIGKSACDEAKSSARISAAAGLIVGALINVYFWICNFSFYKELKTGGGGSAV